MWGFVPARSAVSVCGMFGVSMTTWVDFTTGHTQRAGLQGELAGGLGTHQRDHAVWPALDLDLGHHSVRDDVRDQPDELITS